MMDAGCCGATRASACVSRSVRWDLIAADKREEVAAKKGAYYTLGSFDQVRDAIRSFLEAIYVRRMPRADLRADVFFICAQSTICADGFSSAQHPNSATAAGAT
jgi:hypothetical protein